MTTRDDSAGIPGVITIDLRPLTAALQRQMETIRKFVTNPAIQRAIRMHNDLEHIRRVADRERVIGRIWLDQHMRDMYDDLGLIREPTDRNHQ